MSKIMCWMISKNKIIIKNLITVWIAELIKVGKHMNLFYNYFILNIHTYTRVLG